jgi:hypothetical protein
MSKNDRGISFLSDFAAASIAACRVPEPYASPVPKPAEAVGFAGQELEKTRFCSSFSASSRIFQVTTDSPGTRICWGDLHQPHGCALERSAPATRPCPGAISPGNMPVALAKEKGDSHQIWVILIANEAWPRLKGAPGAEDPVTGRT